MTSTAKTTKKTAKPAVAEEPIIDGDACALPSAPVAEEATEEKPASRKRYRMLTGIDDSSFCQKVSDALADGYELYGSPTMTYNGKNVIVGQAVVLKKKLGKAKKHK